MMPTPPSQQRTIFSFFAKKSASSTPTPSRNDSTKETIDTPEATPRPADNPESSPVKSDLNSSPLKHKHVSSSPVRGPASHERADATVDMATPKLNVLQQPNETAHTTKHADSDEDEIKTTGRGRRVRSVVYAESDDEEAGAKRHRPVSDDESEFELAQESEDDDMDDFIAADDESDVAAPESEEEDVEDVPKRRAAANKSKAKQGSKSDTPNTSVTSVDSGSAPHATPGSSSLSKFTAGSDYVSQYDAQSYKPQKTGFDKLNEERYKWLVDVKDADGVREGEPGYDPRTLYIPTNAWSKFTAFEKQYWEVKSKMWNTVVFFKKGKFYELYERDADIANTEFDLKLAGGGRANMRLCGVPEMSFEHWAAQFIAKGHKVAKVDQVETLLAKEMRETSSNKKEDKVIQRKLQCVLTAGTLMDEAMLLDDMSTFCMAIKEEAGSGRPSFGIIFVDTATGEFSVSSFEDDEDYSKFETLIAQIRPRELILEKGQISARAIRILKNNTSVDTIWNQLKPQLEFWDADTSHHEVVKAKYFDAKDLDDLSNYPPVLRAMLESHSITLSALGALIWYLRSLKIDDSLLSIGNFVNYDPIQSQTSMILDGQSLQNLDVFAMAEGNTDKTLFSFLNNCVTPAGKRKLHHWVCHPLYSVDQINSRFDAVELLINEPDLISYFDSRLVKLPDLERLLSRIHAGKLKPNAFVRVVDGFEQILKALKGLGNYNIGSGLILELIDSLPDLETLLTPWLEAFDRELAKTENLLVPQLGVEDEFDESMKRQNDIEEELQSLLKQYRKQYNSQEICYKDSGKEIFLIEVPLKVTKNIPKDWQQMAANSKTKRYWSPEAKILVRQLMEAREIHKTVSEGVQLRLYRKFDLHYDQWMRVVKIIATLDCLVSLAKVSRSMENGCRPVFDETQSVIELTDLQHPCYQDYIPNDVLLGDSVAKMALLTGANAAGKSTLLRMTCVASIMAQIGCYVCAKSARLSPVDRIMTRLGANDNIMAGKSTFFVELSETKRMLSEATPRSLLVLDELGRGGSSSDGFAIAEAVLHHIATYTGSLGFFATHYGTLYNSFKDHPQVMAKRMAILENNEERKVVFLYKLEDGVSPGSFGMHVAAMCGIDRQIIDAAEVAAEEYEHTSKLKRQTNATDCLTAGIESDFTWALKHDIDTRSLQIIYEMAQKI